MKKSDLEILRPLWIPRSLIRDEDCRQTLKIWLTDGNYYVNNSPPGLSLFCLEDDELKRCLSLDAFRFSTHAAQTLHELEKSTAYEKLTSWRVIQAYYAAFYSAHAILRLFGRSFSHLEAGHVGFLRQRCLSEVGYSSNIQSSYYLIQYDPQTHTVEFSKYGESHKDLWKCFLALLFWIEQRSLGLRASEERRQQLSSYFADLALAITKHGAFPAGNWLSAYRNEVNYKSSGGVWYPFAKNTPSFESILRKMKGWHSGDMKLSSPSLEKSEVAQFFATSLSIVNLNISLSNDYRSLLIRSGRRSGGFEKLVRLAAAA